MPLSFSSGRLLLVLGWLVLGGQAIKFDLQAERYPQSSANPPPPSRRARATLAGWLAGPSRPSCSTATDHGG